MSFIEPVCLPNLRRFVREFFCAFILAAFAGGLLVSPAAAEDKVRLGAALSLTGKLATHGKNVKDGYDFMVKHINARGGIPIGGKKYMVEIKYYDDASDAKTAVKLVEKLIVEDGIKLLLGPYSSGVTFPASSVAEKHKVPMVEAHGAATTIFERDYKYLFATLNTVDQYFGNILQMAVKLPQAPKSIALIAENSLFPKLGADGAAKLAEKLGIKVVYHQNYPSGTKDLSSMLAQVREKNPDILLAGGYINDMILLTKQAKEMGVKPKLFGFLLGPTVPGFQDSLKGDANYLVEPVQWAKSMGWKDEVLGWTASQYAEMFKKEKGYEPDYHPPQSSAAVMVYYHALNKAGTTDPQKVRDEIAKTDIQTFYGPVKFNSQGKNIGKGMAVIQLQDGKHTVVFPSSVAEGKLVYPKPYN